MPQVRVLVGTLAYGPSPERTKIAQKGDVIQLTEEELSRVTVAPAYPATVELVQEERPVPVKKKEKPAGPPK